MKEMTPLSSSSPRRPPVGVVVLCVLVFGYASWDLWVNLDFSRYRFLLQPLPLWMVLIRYACSMVLRVILLAGAVGICLRKDFFRRVLIGTAVFIIATIYWKHPASCFRIIFDRMIAQGALPASAIPKVDTYVALLVLFNNAIDIGIALSLIIYLTRPKVKEYFLIRDEKYPGLTRQS